MRKISRDAGNAFLSKRYFKRDNTRVLRGSETRIDGRVEATTVMVLFGNKIALMDSTGTIAVNFCGYTTQTTKDRINALLQLLNVQGKFSQKNFGLRYNGTPVDSREWFIVRKGEAQ